MLGRSALVLVAAFFAAMVGGALVPENPRQRAPAGGVTIHIDASLVHSRLVLPVAAAGHDWRVRLPLFPDGRAAGPFLSFSWGEREFFLATPTWADFDLRLGLRALVAGHESLVHLYRLDAPAGRPIHLTPAQYRRLVAHLEAAIAPGAPLPGYGPEDMFLPAHGRYSPWQTCNQWTRDALAAAGVRVGRWTPLPQGLMWRFARGEGETR
ncbi:DUF2459 domain-containing protein [Thermaurantiacus sp.]